MHCVNMNQSRFYIIPLKHSSQVEAQPRINNQYYKIICKSLNIKQQHETLYKVRHRVPPFRILDGGAQGGTQK